MGYSAHYTGEFKFVPEINRAGIMMLTGLLKGRADLREQTWKAYLAQFGVEPEPDQYYIDLEFNDDFTGLRHTGGGSVYYASMVSAVKLITALLRNAQPEMKLQGEMEATGEDGERWKIVIDENGEAREIQGKIVYDE